VIPTLEENRLWKRCSIAGCLTLILGAIVIFIFPSEGAAYTPGYGTPVIAFEFATTPAQVKAAIGYGAEGWQRRLMAMKTGTYGDFIFIFAFGTFLVSFFHAAYKQSSIAFYKFMAAIAFIAAGADVIEDILALRILSNISVSSGVEWMHYFAKAKLMALGLCGVGAAIFLLRQPRLLRKAEGVFAGFGGLITLFALTRPEQMGDALGLGVALSWVAMLAYSATQAAKKV